MENSESKFKKLKEENNSLYIQIAKLKKEIIAKDKEIKNLNTEVFKLNNRVKTLEKQLKEIAEDLDEKLGIINCFEQYDKEIHSEDDFIKDKLEQAREIYNDYDDIKYKRGYDQKVKDSLISLVLDIYDDYRWTTINPKCGSMQLNYEKDNLVPEDYLILSKIYGYNEGNAISRLTDDNKINAASNIFLQSIGEVIKRGDIMIKLKPMF
ncbi:MAG: hypothetical protein R2771_06570 [Saprospiraceae bacterium]